MEHSLVRLKTLKVFELLRGSTQFWNITNHETVNLIKANPFVYPNLVDFYRETKISIYKSLTQNLNQSLNIPVALLQVPQYNLRQIGPGVSELWSNKQIEVTT